MSVEMLARSEATRPVDPFAIRVVKRTGLVLLGPAYFVAIAFAPLLCARRRGFRGWYWRLVKRACSRLLWLLSIRAKISPSDREALAQDAGSVIVLSHRSHLDGFALMDAVPDAKWFTFAAKKELCDSRLLRTGFTGAGLVEIDRSKGKHALETLTDAVRAMPDRRSVVMFPEGTRTTSATLGPFKAGAVLVARATGRTIRPIIIHGSEQLLPRGRTFPRSGTITVEVLPPLHCDPDATADQDLERLRTAMMAAFDTGPKAIR